MKNIIETIAKGAKQAVLPLATIVYLAIPAKAETIPASDAAKLADFFYGIKTYPTMMYKDTVNGRVSIKGGNVLNASTLDSITRAAQPNIDTSKVSSFFFEKEGDYTGDTAAAHIGGIAKNPVFIVKYKPNGTPNGTLDSADLASQVKKYGLRVKYTQPSTEVEEQRNGLHTIPTRQNKIKGPRFVSYDGKALDFRPFRGAYLENVGGNYIQRNAVTRTGIRHNN